MPYPITTSAYGIWSLNQVRDAELGNVWPAVGDAVTSPADNPSGVSVASDVWSLRDAYKAEAGGDWPEIYVPPTYYTHPTYGTLVATFVSPDWQPVGAVSVTEGIPQPSDSTNVILSNSTFQSIRAATTANLVYYVWGTSLESYVSFYRSQIESANVKPAPTTTINPNSFGFHPNFRTHWWSETSGSDLTGSDYSFMAYRDTNQLNFYTFGPVKHVSNSNAALLNINTNITEKFYIFYK